MKGMGLIKWSSAGNINVSVSMSVLLSIGKLILYYRVTFTYARLDYRDIPNTRTVFVRIMGSTCRRLCLNDPQTP